MARKRMTDPVETTDAEGKPISVRPPRDPAKAPVYFVMGISIDGEPTVIIQKFRTIGAVRKFKREYPDLVVRLWGAYCLIRASKVDISVLDKVVARNRQG